MRVSLTTVYSIAGLLVANSAWAADMAVKAPPPPAPVFSWTGFYVGGNVGWAGVEWDRSDAALCPVAVGACTPAFIGGIADINTRFATNHFSRSGFTGGVQAGYNYQFGGSGVVGAEVDYAWIDDARQTRTFVGNFYSGFPAETQVLSSTARARDLFTARGRLGFLPIPNLLVYATAGVAESNVSVSHSFAGFGGNGVVGGLSAFENSSASQTVWGGVGGAGLEYSFGSWSIKGEYLYTRLNSVNWTGSLLAVSAAGAPIPVAYNYNHASTLTLEVARIGVNYHFNWPLVAKF